MLILTLKVIAKMLKKFTAAFNEQSMKERKQIWLPYHLARQVCSEFYGGFQILS